ncbi:hypothetical protein ROHU_028847 [Labeo rohita]|uniref:Uncharacterized protein n=1 Tax=Labeo rohita TaxID=84645 RepID=A0A498M3H6_LABRO|nr:hypothetical protein ROHU_030882 [Labeo rohita]RXN14012.1 hypothetical protein ROHU_028847 [Labeo rohita]
MACCIGSACSLQRSPFAVFAKVWLVLIADASATNLNTDTYQLQRCSPWRTVASQWHTWPILAIAVLLLALVPYAVYRMMTAFDNPPPHSLFKSAAIGFGLLSEALLIK